MRTKIIALSLLLALNFLISAHAQEKTWRKEKMNVMGLSHNGFSTTVPFSEYKTKLYLSAYLKENNRISEKRNFTEIKEGPWKGKEDLTKVYALVNGDSTKSRIWLGYSGDAGEELMKAVETEVQNLSFVMNKYHLQFQIKEAESAATFLSKELRNTQRDAQRLSQKLDQNAQEKIRLEQALEQNAQEKIHIEQDLVNNSKNQEDRTKALEEVNRQLELLRERLGKL